MGFGVLPPVSQISREEDIAEMIEDLRTSISLGRLSGREVLTACTVKPVFTLDIKHSPSRKANGNEL